MLVVAPIGRDGALVEAMLTRSGIDATSMRTLEEALPSIEGGRAGALLVTEEALQSAGARRLLALLDAQPTWSDLPILVLSSDSSLTNDVRAASSTLETRANVTLIERPVRARTLVRAAHGALRARRRQYEMREMLERERASRHEVEAASRAKDEFLATVSHELRTPLNAILGWAQLAERGELTPEQLGRAIETIERNALSQSRLIEDLLDVGRIVSGNLRLMRAPVELEWVLVSVCEMLRPMADAKGVTLVTTRGPGVDTVVGDATRLQQVVSNLVSNAVKFSYVGGRVDVDVRGDGPAAVIVSVTDRGEGIEPAFLPHVFERFRHADGSSTRSHGGLGLGLAIVRSLAELHGGSVSASSEGKSRGATFRVRLPTTGVTSDVGAGTAEARRGPVSLRGARILVVDDDADAREIAATVLANHEADVVTASSADEALTQIRAAPPDVLVCDIGMPDRDGYSLMQSVRSLAPERGGSMPAVALTAYTRAADRARALAAGFDEHLTKPVDIGKLVHVVSGLFGRADV